MRLKFDFTAQEGTHFGIVKTLDELLAEIPNPVDYWDATGASMTAEGGKVTAWTGKLGRQFVQTVPARRPTYTGNGLRMVNSAADAAEATMVLAGAQIGPQAGLAIACKVRLSVPAVTVDTQYLWSCPSPVHRVTYRYSAGNNYMRAQVLGTAAANNIDCDIAAGVTDIGAVYVANGTSYTLHVAGAGSSALVGADGVNMASVILGGATDASPSLRGWMQRVGIWQHVPTQAQIDTMLKWVS